jgi:hypothetical protein
MSHCGQKVGERSERLWRVIRQQKADMDVGPKQAHRRALAQRHLPPVDRDTTVRSELDAPAA